MSRWELLGYALGAVPTVYVLVRVGSHAYFLTKRQHERQDNGTHKKSR